MVMTWVWAGTNGHPDLPLQRAVYARRLLFYPSTDLAVGQVGKQARWYSGRQAAEQGFSQNGGFLAPGQDLAKSDQTVYWARGWTREWTRVYARVGTGYACGTHARAVVGASGADGRTGSAAVWRHPPGLQ